ncbi:hypothetical protein GCM10019016_136590 [Streptomyces prasinosporus]|uniref:Uncharacterized protein n=1 Tax=Streptomyces prasinosporus TaxID=68256 RepID=A0ABP6UHU7_9ACTN
MRSALRDALLLRPGSCRGCTSHEGRTVAVAGPDSVWFDTPVETYGKSLTTYADFTVAPGDRITFTVSWQPSHKEPPPLPEPEQSLEATEDFWREWVEHCTYHGPYREAVIRSLITLKALTYAPDRRDRRRAHHLPAGGHRRRPQLGLPLHLAAGRGDHPVLAAAHRLPRGGPRLARVAAARGGRRPGEPADHVRHRR